jgi:N-methylhydantoinase A
MDTPVYGRSDLSHEPMPGPFIVEDYDATTLVPPDTVGHLDRWGNIAIEIDRLGGGDG